MSILSNPGYIRMDTDYDIIFWNAGATTWAFTYLLFLIFFILYLIFYLVFSVNDVYSKVTLIAI